MNMYVSVCMCILWLFRFFSVVAVTNLKEFSGFILIFDIKKLNENVLVDMKMKTFRKS